MQLGVTVWVLYLIVFWAQSSIKTWRLCLSAAPPLSQATTSPQPQRTTPTTTTTTTAHWGVANTTTTTGLKEGSRGAPKAPPLVPKTTPPPPLESFPLPERFCKATEERDIMWPQTPRGMLVERPCPKGTRGKQCSPSPRGNERGLIIIWLLWGLSDSCDARVSKDFFFFIFFKGHFKRVSEVTPLIAFSCVVSGWKRDWATFNGCVVERRAQLVVLQHVWEKCSPRAIACATLLALRICRLS